jgi:hypothetical protein
LDVLRKKKVIIAESKVYKKSEMAALMLKMYEANLEIKSLILDGKTPNDFPVEFINMHTAQPTDPSDRN